MAGVMTILQPASIYAADMTEEAFAFESESVNDDSVKLCSPSPDVDGVSDSPYTSSNHQTDRQPKAGRGLPSIDDLQSEQETVEDNSGSGIFDDGGFTSDFDTADTEESVEDNSGGDAFITSSETVSEDITTDEPNTQTNPLSLIWNGVVSECNEQYVLTEIKKEDGTELSSSEMLILNSINKDAKKNWKIKYKNR